MAIKGQQTVVIIKVVDSTGAGKTGQSATLTLYPYADGVEGTVITSATELSADHVPGLYAVTVPNGSNSGVMMLLGGVCSTSGCVVLPVQWTNAVNMSYISDTAVSAASAQLGVNVVNWKGSAAPANTGDAYARLGAPSGASVSADIAAKPTAAQIVSAVEAAVIPVDVTQVNGVAAGTTSDLATATALTAVGNLVDQVKTVTDILNGMISSGAWLSSVYANMPTVVGPGSRPVAIGPIYKAGTTTPISGVEATIYTESSLASLPIDRKWSDLLGYAHTYLSPGTYYVTLVRSDEIFSGNPYTIVVPEA